MSKKIRRHIDSFRDFINENKSDDDEYIDYLLDKINKKGIDSLSDGEKNKLSDLSHDNIEDRTVRIIDGEIYIGDVSYDRYISQEYKKNIYPKSDEISDANRMFFSIVKKMNISNIQIDDNLYPVDFIYEMSGEHLKVGDYIISPFYEGQMGISVNHKNEYWLYEVNLIPTSIQEMNNFIEEFFKRQIKEILIK
jgi:hypothetical protein